MGFVFGVIILNLDGGDDAQLYDYIKKHRTVYFKKVKFMICELCLAA